MTFRASRHRGVGGGEGKDKADCMDGVLIYDCLSPSFENLEVQAVKREQGMDLWKKDGIIVIVRRLLKHSFNKDA